MEKNIFYPKNHWTLRLKEGLDVFFAGFWDLQTPSDLRSHDS